MKLSLWVFTEIGGFLKDETICQPLIWQFSFPPFHSISVILVAYDFIIFLVGCLGIGEHSIDIYSFIYLFYFLFEQIKKSEVV